MDTLSRFSHCADNTVMPPRWSVASAAACLAWSVTTALVVATPAWAQGPSDRLGVSSLAPTVPISLVPSLKDYPVAAVMTTVLFLIVIIMMIYGVRHMIFTLNRLVGEQRHPYVDISIAQWPMITVFIAAHNEEKVIAGCIEALLNTDYPIDRLKIVPVNDRSQDSTARIIDSYVERFPGRISPFHRVSGKAGKSAALKDALAFSEGDIAIIFDADYVPGRGLLKQLVAPFFDPEIGAVMGRVCLST